MRAAAYLLQKITLDNALPFRGRDNCAHLYGTGTRTFVAKPSPIPRIEDSRDAIVKGHCAARSADPTFIYMTATFRRWRVATSWATSLWAR